eukprot:3245482-Amphidinium_carterae.1
MEAVLVPVPRKNQGDGAQQYVSTWQTRAYLGHCTSQRTRGSCQETLNSIRAQPVLFAAGSGRGCSCMCKDWLQETVPMEPGDINMENGSINLKLAMGGTSFVLDITCCSGRRTYDDLSPRTTTA